jgi:putative ABC transport system permease protein
MAGAMSMENFIIAGTISFGIELMDRGSIIVDLEDARMALDMYDGAGMILGFIPGGFYNNDESIARAASFNENMLTSDDEFAPVMKAFGQQG